jgi:hypothetical protein
VGALVGGRFVELVPEVIVVDFLAGTEIGFGVGEEFVRTRAAQIIFTDSLVVPLEVNSMIWGTMNGW